MILRARHHKVIFPFFYWYTRVLISRHFSSVHISGQKKEYSKPILLLSNHISWWDGFWALLLTKKVLQKKFHFMMLEDQLRKYWYFNYCGGFSVSKGNRSVLETLTYASELLKNPSNLVLLFPQGKIESMHQNLVLFEKGFSKIAQKSGDIQVVFVANFIEYGSRKKPSLYMFLHNYTLTDYSYNAVMDAYNSFYTESKTRVITTPYV